MGEGAPNQEQGTYEAFEGGSFEDYLSAAKVRVEGIENAMQGIGDAARIARDISGLGHVAEKLPEFKHWAQRRLGEIAKIAEQAKRGEEFSDQIKEWHLDVGEAVVFWDRPKEDIMWYESNTRLLREMNNLQKIREILEGRLKSETNTEAEIESDKGDLEYAEDVLIPQFLMDQKRQRQAEKKMYALFDKYKIESKD